MHIRYIRQFEVNFCDRLVEDCPVDVERFFFTVKLNYSTLKGAYLVFCKLKEVVCGCFLVITKGMYLFLKP